MHCSIKKERRYFMKKNCLVMIAIVLIYIFTLLGCKNETDENKRAELTNYVEGPFGIEGVHLREGVVELKVNPFEKESQLTKDYLITNTTQIVVSVEKVHDSIYIDLCLYSSESTEEPIAFATISSDKNTAVFANLTASTAYRVGATIRGSSDTITLMISD